MFAIRAALAATLLADLGRVRGLRAVRARAGTPGSEEYLDSEKYAAAAARLRRRAGRGPLAGAVADAGSTRSAAPTRRCSSCATPAVPRHRQRRGPRLLARRDPATGDTVLVVAQPRPVRTRQAATSACDLPALGMRLARRGSPRTTRSPAQTYDWGQANYVRLEPWRAVAHILAVAAPHPDIPPSRLGRARARGVSRATRGIPAADLRSAATPSGGTAESAHVRASAVRQPARGTAEVWARGTSGRRRRLPAEPPDAASGLRASRIGRGRRGGRHLTSRGRGPVDAPGTTRRLVQARRLLRGARPGVHRLRTATAPATCAG